MNMPKTPKEIERIILKDGWKLSRNSKDSHRQYNHPYKGGNIVATGTPEEVARVKNSYTGAYLKKILGEK